MLTQADHQTRPATSPAHYTTPERPRIGRMLVENSTIDEAQADEIASHAEATGLRFGEAAIALGYIDEADLRHAIAHQFDAMSGDEANADERLVAFTEPGSPAAEDFRSLRNALALRWFKHPEGARTLAVISSDRGDGRSTVAANLAISFAQVGFRTLLIDGDMRNPIQHRLFNLADHAGLSNYLAGRPETSTFYQIPTIANLTVMPAGGLPPNPQELLLRGMLQSLMRKAEEEFEVTIIDTPASTSASDYQLIGVEAVGALVVTNRDRSRTRDVRKLVKHSREFGIRLVGSTMAGAA